MKNQVARSKKQPEKCNLDDRLTYVLWRAQHACERRLVAALSDTGLNMSHFGLMKHLHIESGLTGAEIARRLDVTPQSISSALAVVRKRGLVRATAHPVHRGLIELELTDEGRAMLHELRERVLSVEEEISSALSVKEREQVMKTLSRIRALLRGEDESEAQRIFASR